MFSAPRVAGPTRREDGDYEVEVEGMDIYDPVSSTLAPTESARIAAWFLDTDYDGRTFCICQAFFPDKSKWRRLAKGARQRRRGGQGRLRRPERPAQPAVRPAARPAASANRGASRSR